jgi:hypothetical protein
LKIIYSFGNFCLLKLYLNFIGVFLTLKSNFSIVNRAGFVFLSSYSNSVSSILNWEGFFVIISEITFEKHKLIDGVYFI